jgi:hypothetical protein
MFEESPYCHASQVPLKYPLFSLPKGVAVVLRTRLRTFVRGTRFLPARQAHYCVTGGAPPAPIYPVLLSGHNSETTYEELRWAHTF